MEEVTASGSGSGIDLYGVRYRGFASTLYADIRREAFGEDIGQTGWLTAGRLDQGQETLAVASGRYKRHVLDALVQSRRDCRAALRLMRKLLNEQGTAPRVMITDKLRSYGAARNDVMPGVEHRSHKGLNNRAENSHLVVRRRERTMKRFKSSRQRQRFVSIHGPITNLFHYPRNLLTSTQYRELRTASMMIHGA